MGKNSVGMTRASRKTVEQPRRAVGYVRISRERANETSTNSQQKAIEAYCVARGWQLVKVAVATPGVRADLLLRPRLRGPPSANEAGSNGA